MRWLCGAVALLLAGGLLADTGIQDCYDNKELATVRPRIELSVIVMLDETTVFDATQRAAIEKELVALVRPGVELRLLTFSAYISGRYTTPILSATFAQPLTDSERMHTRKPTAAEFDTCREIQLIAGKKRIVAVVRQYFQNASPDIAKSDIIGAIKDAGDIIVPSLAARRKTFLIVSDMLENSQLTTFYSRGGVRRIEPPQELRKVERSSLFTDFRGAHVFVFGAGVLPVAEKSRSGVPYVDRSTLGALKSFWQSYVERSNGQLVEFGQPLLLKPIQ